MSNRRFTFQPPREMRFAFGYVESKPVKTKTAQGNRLWESQPMRAKLYDETRQRMESDLDAARQRGDWGKVNRLAALLSKLMLTQ